MDITGPDPTFLDDCMLNQSVYIKKNAIRQNGADID